MSIEPVVAIVEDIRGVPGIAIAIRIGEDPPTEHSFFQNLPTDTVFIQGFHITVCLLEKSEALDDRI